jgi:hypothetical protein
MSLRFAACASVFAVTAMACVHTEGPVFERHPYPKETIAATVVGVSFRDWRAGVVTDSFETPAVSLPGDGEKKPVRVSPATVGEMKRRLARLVGGGNEQLTVDIELKSGDAGWEASWTSETALAQATLQVTFRRATTGAVLLRAWGKAWGWRSSMDVADEEPGELFQAAVLAAFDRAVAKQVVVEHLSQTLR